MNRSPKDMVLDLLDFVDRDQQKVSVEVFQELESFVASTMNETKKPISKSTDKIFTKTDLAQPKPSTSNENSEKSKQPYHIVSGKKLVNGHQIRQEQNDTLIKALQELRKRMNHTKSKSGKIVSS